MIAKVKNAKCIYLSFSRHISNIPSIPKNIKIKITNPLDHWSKDDGYRLTYGGLDYLALHAHLKHGTIYSVGNQIGVGKESDIFVVADKTGRQFVLKIHRLGRISFRTVKANRDYLRKRSSASWMYMSRLAAVKEFAFMKALGREAGLAVPEAIAQNRHTIVMSLVDAFPLRQISQVPDPSGLYAELVEMVLRLAGLGLIHADFNEFNILIKEEEQEAAGAKSPIIAADQEQEQEQRPTTQKPTLTPILIDFPQMVSVDHPNAEFYFDRDVSCIKRFFQRRFHFVSDAEGPTFADARDRLQSTRARLDVEVEASGFSRKMAKELEAYMRDVGVDGDGDGGGRSEGGEGKGASGSEEDDEEEEEVEEEGEVEDSTRETVDDRMGHEDPADKSDPKGPC